MRTESYSAYWERQITEAEKRIDVAKMNLTRIALQSQLRLFELPEAQIVQWPVRVILDDVA